jgi:hypothetical protein
VRRVLERRKIAQERFAINLYGPAEIGTVNRCAFSHGLDKSAMLRE